MAKLHEIFGITSGCDKNQDHSDFNGLPSFGCCLFEEFGIIQ